MCTYKSGYAGDQYNGNDKGKMCKIINITANMYTADDKLGLSVLFFRENAKSMRDAIS